MPIMKQLINLHYQINVFLKLKKNSFNMPSCSCIGQTYCTWSSCLKFLNALFGDLHSFLPASFKEDGEGEFRNKVSVENMNKMIFKYCSKEVLGTNWKE